MALCCLASAAHAQGPHATAWLYATNTVAGSTEVNVASPASLLWHTDRVDTAYFHLASATNRLTVRRSGDYLVAVTLPVSSAHSGDNDRACIRTEVHVNRSGVDSVVEGGTGESSYLRLRNFHQQSSDHIAVLATNLSAGDFMEVKVRGTAEIKAAVEMGRASWYAEYIASDRAVFTATTTNNVTNNLQCTSQSPLLWDAGLTNAAFQHVDGDTGITLKAAGNYLVFINLPLAGNGSTARQAPKLLVQLNGSTVPGGQARQGYMRQNGEGNDYASLQWSGLVRATSANRTLRVQVIRETTAGGVVTVQAGRVGSIYVEKIDAGSGVYFGRGTKVEGNNSNWNPSPARSVEWSTDWIIDTNCFAHSTSTDKHRITIKEDGHYLLVYNDNLKETGTQRGNPVATVEVNGVARPGAQTKCHYIRQNTGHQESSGSLVYLLTDMTNGAVVEVSLSRDKQSGSVNNGATAILMLWRRPLYDPHLPVIEHTGAPTNVTSTNAWIGATLTSTGAAPTQVWAYWGTTDAGTNLTWAFTNDFGPNGSAPPVPYSCNATGLVADTVYYYRFRAANAHGTYWARSTGSFMTGGLTVDAADPLAAEAGTNTGMFVISRPASLTNGALTVNYSLSGTASNGQDYALLSGTVDMVAGQSNATVTVTPWDDIDSGESNETVVLTILPGAYRVGSPATATVTIADNDLSPDQIAGLQFWLDAESGVRTGSGTAAGNGDAVGYWDDRSALGHTAEQADSAMRPIYVTNGLNGRPVVRLSGSNGMSVAHAAGLDAGIAQTAFALFSLDTGSSIAFKGAVPGSGVGEWRVTPSSYGVSGALPGGLDAASSGDIRLVTGRYTGSKVQVYHNGSLKGEVAQSGVAVNGNSLVLGSAAPGDNLLNGGIGQVILYNRSLNDSEREQVETYLLGKYFGVVRFGGLGVPGNATVLDPVDVSIEVSPLAPLSDIAVTLWYREGTSGPFSAIPMVHVAGDRYVTSVPIPRGSATTVEYYIEVTYSGAGSGTLHWPAGGAAAPASFARADADPRQSGPCRRRTGLTVSEIMYHPPAAYGSTMEYVELANTEPVPCDISGYRISGDIDYTFPTGTVIGAHQRLVVAADPSFAASFYGLSGVTGPFSGKLSNGGGTLRLRNRHNAVLLELEFSDAHPWPAQADGGGHSLVLARPDLGEGDDNAWSASASIHGSPGVSDRAVDDPMADVVVNEVLMHTDLPQIDFIELYNHSTQAVNISGGVLTDDPNGTNAYTMPPGTTLPAGGFLSFDQNTLGFSLSKHGDDVYFVNTNANRVVDAVRLPAQANGMSTGRYPDGGPRFRVLPTTTPGAANGKPVARDVVINEIMYHPISGDSDDEYIELHNRGAAAVDLTNWRFIEGVEFTFPTGALIQAGGYVVVARDAQRLIGKYPQLGATNTFGDFSGRLADGGERVVLARPDDPLVPTNDFVVMDTVAYGDGDIWGEWADGDGSSLELVDPHSDNRLPMNWAGSDETMKSAWTTIAVTGIVRAAIDGLTSEGTIVLNEFHVYMLHTGECLVDDFSVVSSGGVVRAEDDFETDMSKWSLLGNHKRSGIETNDAYGGAQCLRVRSSGVGDSIHADNQRPPPFYNRLVTTVAPTFADGEVATIHAKARWLRGDPYVVLVVKAFALEAVGELPVPDNLGTPGQENGAYRSNAGPAIGDVAHAPVLPADGQPVVVTCSVDDPDGVGAVELRYRLDPTNSLNTVTMADDGLGADVFPGDGLYSGVIPGCAAGTLAAFHVAATDAAASPVTNTFPSDAPVRECLVRFGDPPAIGDIQTYRIWMTAANITEWENRHARDNEVLDCTLVYGNERVIYNGGARYRGNFRSLKGPTGSKNCAYLFMTPKSDRLLGANELKIDQCGQNGTDTTRQREHTGYWLGAEMGLASSYLRYIQVRVNHSDRGIMHDFQPPTRDLAESWYGVDDPPIFRIMTNRGLDIHLLPDGSKNQARYRVSWQKKIMSYRNDDYTSIFRIADALNLADTAEFMAATEALVDVNQWLGVVAFNHVIINSDAFGYNFRHNAYAYVPEYDRMRIFFADLDNGLHPNDSPTASLTSVSDDPYTKDMFAVPEYMRMYWRHLRRAALGPMEANAVNSLIDSWHAAFLANGFSPASPQALKDRIAGRRAHILSELGKISASFEITTNAGNDFSTAQPIVTLAGAAPIEVKTLVVNGAAHPARFPGLTTWESDVALTAGPNAITIQGRDEDGLVVASDTITVTFTGTALSPDDLITINEIMYNPVGTDAEFVELHNLSPSGTLDLAGLRLNGVDFTFGSGSFIGPTGYVVVAESIPAYAAAYSNAEVVVGDYAGTLDNGGETLSIQKPLTTNTWSSIDTVRFDDELPWPPQADNGGYSLQLIDPEQDNSVAANWAVGGAVLHTPGRANSVRHALPGIPDITINEIQPRNGSTLADNAGDFDPWVELYHGTTAFTNLNGFYLTDDPANPTNWAFPAGYTIGTGDFVLVWADGEPGEATATDLHAGFAMNSDTGSLTLVWVYGGVTTALDHVEYGNIATNRSYGLYPDGDTSLPRIECYYPTPGFTNNPTVSPASVRINEWMADNNTTIIDPADNNYEDWFELYNAGSAAADLSGYTLTDDTGTQNKWTFPTGSVIAAGGFLHVWADGDPQQTGGGSYHADFSLRRGGEEIAIYSPSGILVDHVTFGSQSGDISQGRYRDGGTFTYFMGTPTPGSANIAATLVVSSPCGSPTPPRGTNAYDYNTPVVCQVAGSPAVSSGVRRVCSGWTGTGQVPASGTGTSLTVTVTGPSSISWEWPVEYALTVAAGPNGSVSTNGGWYDAGATGVAVSARGDHGYELDSWSGDVPAGQTNAASLSLTMDMPRDLTAAFALGSYAITATAGPNGSITPSGTTHVPGLGSVTIVCTPDPGFDVDTLTVDGLPVQPVSVHTFSNIGSNHTISVTFGPDKPATLFIIR